MTLSDIEKVDWKLIHSFRMISMPFARFGLCVVFSWFGLLKVLGISPASNLARDLFEYTISFTTFETFFVLFGLFECLIGILFIIRGAERLVIPLLFAHLAITFLPLFLLPQETWSGFMVPTLEGQYIIKNLFIIATAVGIASHLHPMRSLQS